MNLFLTRSLVQVSAIKSWKHSVAPKLRYKAQSAVRAAHCSTATAAVHTNSTRIVTVQGDILESECNNTVYSLTDMKLSAALGSLECQWLLLTCAVDVCQQLGQSHRGCVIQ